MRRSVDSQPADRRHLRDDAAHATVDRSDHEGVAAGEARAPRADAPRVDAFERLQERDRVAVVAHLQPRIELLPRLAVALTEVAVVVGEDDVPRGRERGCVLVEVQLLDAVVAMGDDHGRRGRGRSSGPRAVQPAAQRGAVGGERDVRDLVRGVRGGHAAILTGVGDPGQAELTPKPAGLWNGCSLTARARTAGRGGSGVPEA
jgi:hypothetical protein